MIRIYHASIYIDTSLCTTIYNLYTQRNINLSVYLFLIYPSIFLHANPYIYRSICLSASIYIYLLNRSISIHTHADVSICVCFSICLSLSRCNIYIDIHQIGRQMHIYTSIHIIIQIHT